MFRALLLAVATGCAASPAHAEIRLDQLPQSWSDDAGKPFKLDDLRGHRVVLTMAYATCHKFCPMTIDQMKRMQALLDARGESAEFVVVGYDPDSDDAAAWHEYRTNRRLNRGNWHFLSGSRDATERFARALGFGFWKYDEHVMHDSRAVVFDADGVQTSALGPETKRWADVL